MPQLTLRYQVTPEALGQIDSLRGEMAVDEFLSRCIQMGLMHFAYEADSAVKEYIDGEVRARNDHFRKYRDVKALVSVPPQTAPLKLPSSP